jgi:hypothetical protein
VRKLIEEPQRILSLLEHPIDAYLHILKALTIKASSCSVFLCNPVAVDILLFIVCSRLAKSCLHSIKNGLGNNHYGCFFEEMTNLSELSRL